MKHISPHMAQLVNVYVASAIAPMLFLYMKATNINVNWNMSGIAWATFTTLIAFAANLSYLMALQKSSAHLVTGITCAYPAVTAILAMIFLGENVTLMKFLGILTIVAGTIMLGL